MVAAKSEGLSIQSQDEVVIEGEIALNRLEQLKANLVALNTKFSKLGLPAVTLDVGKAVPRFFENDSEGICTEIWVANVTLRGPAYRLGNYRLIAAIEHNSEPVSFRSITSHAIPGRYLRAESQCDHCNTTRLRNTTFLLTRCEVPASIPAEAHAQDQPAGEPQYLQVGSSCLEEYTGVSPLAALAATSAFAEWRAFVQAQLGIQPEERCRKVRSSVMPLLRYLESVAHFVHLHGWVSRTKAREAAEDGRVLQATADLAIDQVQKQRLDFLDDEQVHLDPHVSQEDRELAQQALAFAKAAYAIDNDNPMDAFTATLASIARSANVEVDLAGQAAYLVQAYLKSRLTHTDASASQWIGDVDGKICVEVEVMAITEMPAFRGVKRLHIMQDTCGNRLVWFCTGTPLKVGARICVNATVKAHDTYKDRRQTVLVRVKAAPPTTHSQPMKEAA